MKLNVSSQRLFNSNNSPLISINALFQIQGKWLLKNVGKGTQKLGHFS